MLSNYHQMRFGITTTLVALIPCLLSGCSVEWSLGGVRGSGEVQKESREVGGFSSINLHSLGKVVIKQGEKESLTISAEDNLLPLLVSRVANGTLHLEISNGINLRPTKPIEYIVEVKTLEDLQVSGVGQVESKDLKSPKLSVSLSGVGNIDLKGSVEILDLKVSGVGSFQGADLQTKKAKVRNSGVGNAIINVSDQLDATVSGVGTIEFFGNPSVNQSVCGIGKIRKR